MRHRCPAVALAFCVFLLAAIGSAPAQERAPMPYAAGEFPSWLRELWRAEVVFIGSFPFSVFFTLEGYDTFKYMANGFKPELAPWPFRPSTLILYTQEESIGLLVSAIVLSLGAAAADFIIGRVNSPPQGLN